MENREIRFRGQRLDNREWVYGFYHEVEAEGKKYCYIFWQGNSTPILEETVGQFTGLLDKNGKEIFENDRVRILYTDWPSNTDDSISLEDYKKSISKTGIISWDEESAGWGIKMYSDKYQEDFIGSIHHGKHGEIEVIGTIHDTKPKD